MLSSGLSGHRSVDSITDFTGRSLKFSGFSDKKNWDWLFEKNNNNNNKHKSDNNNDNNNNSKNNKNNDNNN